MLPVAVGPSTALWWGGCLNCGGVKLMLGQAATSPMCSTAPMGSAAPPTTGRGQRSPASTGHLPRAAISQQLCLAWLGLATPLPAHRPVWPGTPSSLWRAPPQGGGTATGVEKQGLLSTALLGSARSCSFCSQCLVPSCPSARLRAQRLSLLPPATAW